MSLDDRPSAIWVAPLATAGRILVGVVFAISAIWCALYLSQPRVLDTSPTIDMLLPPPGASVAGTDRADMEAITVDKMSTHDGYEMYPDGDRETALSSRPSTMIPAPKMSRWPFTFPARSTSNLSS